MRRVIGTSIFLLTVASANAGGMGDVFGAFAGRFDSYGSGHDGQSRQMDDVLVQVSQYMNKRMPEMIDSGTRLDRVSAEPGAHFSYHYTLLDSVSTNVDKSNFAIEIRQQIQSTLCDSAQVRNFFNHGVTVLYTYKGKDGLPIGGAEFAPNSCTNAKVAESRS